jgi:threonine/homoserine/homoserine lactone efflux protein
VAATYLGVAPLISRPTFRVVFYVAAALVLGELARSSLKEAFATKEAKAAAETSPPAPSRDALAVGFLITLSNPMTAVFYLSLFGGAVAALHEAGLGVHLRFVGGVVTGCLLWSLVLASVLAWGRERVGERWYGKVSLLSGLILACFAARFLWKAVEEVRGWAG